jgi:hypothetical protein
MKGYLVRMAVSLAVLGWCLVAAGIKVSQVDRIRECGLAAYFEEHQHELAPARTTGEFYRRASLLDKARECRSGS